MQTLAATHCGNTNQEWWQTETWEKSIMMSTQTDVNGPNSTQYTFRRAVNLAKITVVLPLREVYGYSVPAHRSWCFRQTCRQMLFFEYICMKEVKLLRFRMTFVVESSAHRGTAWVQTQHLLTLRQKWELFICFKSAFLHFLIHVYLIHTVLSFGMVCNVSQKNWGNSMNRGQKKWQASKPSTA